MLLNSPLRDEMTDISAVRALMAKDMIEILVERGLDAGITERDLRERGWTESQIRNHGGNARERMEIQRSKHRAQAGRHLAFA
ncbi:hypothetical protein ACETRX_22725 [Labrys portucalensis]|uniref:Uncharacterized protein n=1 Tax=Labrys neptuniae TaxID=376174 RepID=A0ABV6ZJX7_9HYPH